MHPRAALFLTVLLSLALQPGGPALAAYQAQSLEDALPESVFRDGYVTRQWSLATDINETGQLFGYQLTAEGQLRSFNLGFSENPAFSVVDTPDFMALSAGDSTCIWVICITEAAFGILLTEAGALTSVVGGPSDTSPLPGSLPFAYLPGDFVEENREGVVATTQVLPTGGQFGAVLFTDRVVVLDTIPWLIDINDGAAPLVLGYDGDDADCQIYGIDCDTDEEDPCSGDRHRHTSGIGHHSHGRGHGYGHHCDKEQTAGVHPRSSAATSSLGALLIDPNGESPVFMRFPENLPDVPGVTAQRLFPLAMNQSLIVLRADLLGSEANYPGRLVLCRYDPDSPDTDNDDVVDCQSGLELAETDLADSHAIGTVLGFSVNDNDRLIGNFGFSAAGIGFPMVLDIGEGNAELLANRLQSPFDGELSVISAIDNDGEGVGYGYQACGEVPDAIRLLPALAGDPAPVFSYPASIPPTWVAPSGELTLSPVATGAGGEPLYRYWQWTDGEWQLLQDWSALPHTMTAPEDTGEICVRMDVADSLAMERQRQLVVRLRVTVDSPDDDAGTPLLPSSFDPVNVADAAEQAFPLGNLPTTFIGLLLLVGRRRSSGRV